MYTIVNAGFMVTTIIALLVFFALAFIVIPLYLFKKPYVSKNVEFKDAVNGQINLNESQRNTFASIIMANHHLIFKPIPGIKKATVAIVEVIGEAKNKEVTVYELNFTSAEEIKIAINSDVYALEVLATDGVKVKNPSVALDKLTRSIIQGVAAAIFVGIGIYFFNTWIAGLTIDYVYRGTKALTMGALGGVGPGIYYLVSPLAGAVMIPVVIFSNRFLSYRKTVVEE